MSDCVVLLVGSENYCLWTLQFLFDNWLAINRQFSQMLRLDCKVAWNLTILWCSIKGEVLALQLACLTVLHVLYYCLIAAPADQYCPSCVLSPWWYWWSARTDLPECKVRGWSGTGIADCSGDAPWKQFLFTFSQKTKAVTT